MEIVRTFRLSLIELKIFATLFRVIFVLFKCRFTMVELLVKRKQSYSTTLWFTVSFSLKFSVSSLMFYLAISSMNKLMSLIRNPVFDRSRERSF